MVALAIVTLLILTPLLGARWIDHRELGWQRDRWLVAMVAVGVLVVAYFEPMLGAALLAVLAWWRHERTLPSVVTWAAIAGLWFLVRALETDARVLILAGLLCIAVLETGLLLAQTCLRRQPRGTFGHRTFAGAFLAMVCPFAFAAHWGLGLVVLIGLALTVSWAAWLAASVGLAWLTPWVLIPVGAMAGTLAVLAWPLWVRAPDGSDLDVWANRWLGVRGVSLDGLRARALAWLYLGQRLSLRGHGPRATHGALLEGFVRSGYRGIEGSPAHNEVLEYLYDYGALGALTVALAAWRIVPALTPGVPLSAAVVAGLVLMQGMPLLQSPATGVPWVMLVAWTV